MTNLRSVNSNFQIAQVKIILPRNSVLMRLVFIKVASAKMAPLMSKLEKMELGGWEGEVLMQGLYTTLEKGR